MRSCLLKKKQAITEAYNAIDARMDKLIEKVRAETSSEYAQNQDNEWSLEESPKFGLERLVKDVFDFFRR